MNVDPLIALFAIVLALAWARLGWWWAKAPAEARSAGRMALLVALQPLWLALLWWTLRPPSLPVAGGSVTILTRDWQRAPGGDSSRAIALPEANVGPGAERAPDLASALRRFPEVRRIVVRGEGLGPRDRAAAAGLTVDFRSAPITPGLVRIDPPPPAAPGAGFRVSGQASGPSGAVELLDPADRRVDAAAIGPDGTFSLSGTARLAGTALFTLRLRDAGGELVDRAAVPVRTIAAPETRLLLIGAPGPEIKYLRRWASDAGMKVSARLGTGGGVVLGDTTVLDAGTLARTDVAILDDRAWAGLSPGERAALAGAVRGGMGLLLRVTGPVPADVAGDWRPLGFGLAGGATVPLTLPKEAIDLTALAARRGPGSDDAPAATNAGQNDAPPLTRANVGMSAPDSVPLVAALPMLGRWRAVGLGRAGVWTLTDSFALALGGQGERYNDLWSAATGALARGAGRPEPRIDVDAGVGNRMALCDLPTGARVLGPDGRVTALLPDPAAGGCAGFWPRAAGWHDLRAAGQSVPFYVWPADQLRGVRASVAGAATRALAGPATGEDARAGSAPGPAWPWFLGWLAVSALLWWFERSRVGRAGQGAD